jgi:hypothetical protein
MVPDASKTCLGLEYFVNKDEPFWSFADAGSDNAWLQGTDKNRIGRWKAGWRYVVRMPKAYPVYDRGYTERLNTLRDWLKTIHGLYCIGRNGQHRYNNQDHSMMTALIAARNMHWANAKTHGLSMKMQNTMRLQRSSMNRARYPVLVVRVGLTLRRNRKAKYALS